MLMEMPGDVPLSEMKKKLASKRLPSIKQF